MTIGQERSIFLEALAIVSPDERQTYLEEACCGNKQLLISVTKLIEAHICEQNPLDSPIVSTGSSTANRWRLSAFDNTDSSSPSGRMLGPYRLREQIGEGGFGLVFVADQEEPVRRRVALKIIKPGMESREVLARFEAERQVLALMDHPNIARVFDAGVTDSGQPYFVMELVRGIPLCKFCDKQQLSTKERLELFISICNALQHAHQKGIIHRDLKPSNVLVTLLDGKPLAKVIDFGVAKAIGQSLPGKSIYTRFTSMIGTPAYMSPEQAEMSAVDVDTRSDIYSLGVLLFELLVGSPPFEHDRLNSVDFDELRRIIRDEDPPRPSARVSTVNNELASTISRNRRIEPSRLRMTISGDLDWIVMKAIDKDRNRRYQTAGDLADDLARFMTEQPVEARPPTLRYKFHKFARRNKVTLTTALIVACALVLGSIVSVWQAQKAIAARQELEQFTERLKEANTLLASGRTHADSSRWSAAHADYCAATETQPRYYHVWTERGSMYVKLGLWDLAAADFVKALELGAPTGGPEWWGVPQLLWFADQRDFYQDLCSAKELPDHAQELEFVLRGWLVGDLKGAEVDLLVERAESICIPPERDQKRRDHHRPPHNRPPPPRPGIPFGPHFYVAGWAHYRAGNYEEAIRRLEQVKEAPWPSRDIGSPILAMAYHRLGQNAEAETALVRSQLAMDSWLAESIQSNHATAIPWLDWIEFLLNYRTAVELIEGEKLVEDPRLRQLTARSMAAID